MHRIDTKYAVILASTLCLYASCEKIVDSQRAEDSSVLCMLTVNQKEQRIYIYRTADIDEQQAYYYSYLGYPENFVNFFISDAVVGVKEKNSSSHPFEYHSVSLSNGLVDSIYYRNMDSLFIFPDSSYTLSIQYNGQNVTGETTIPGDFDIVYPVDGQTIVSKSNLLPVDIRMTKSFGSNGHIVNVTLYSNGVSNHINMEAYSYTIVDSVFVQGIPLRSWTKTDSCRIDIYAFDENYFNHTFNNVDHSGITGAYGFFGSAVLKSVTVKVQ